MRHDQDPICHLSFLLEDHHLVHPEAAALTTLQHTLLCRHQDAALAHSHQSVMPRQQSAVVRTATSAMLMDRNPWLVRVLKAVIGEGLLRLNRRSKQTTYETYETASLPLLSWCHNGLSEHWTVLARPGTMEKLSIWLTLG